MEKTKVTQKQRLFLIVASICIVLIGVTSWSATNPFLGENIAGNEPPFPTTTFITSTPTPTRSIPFLDYVPTVTPTRPPTTTEPLYLSLYMAPNPATQRDNVLGDIYANFWGVQVTVHYIDYITYTESITLVNDIAGIGHGQFNIMLKSGSYDFWVTYDSITSNHVTLVVH